MCRIKIAHLFAGRLLRNELPLIMTKSSVSARELLAVREDLLLDLKGDLRLDLDAAASLDDFLDDTKWAKLESTDTEVRIRFWNVKENNCRKYRFQEIKQLPFPTGYNFVVSEVQNLAILSKTRLSKTRGNPLDIFRAGF